MQTPFILRANLNMGKRDGSVWRESVSAFGEAIIVLDAGEVSCHNAYFVWARIMI